MMFLVMVSRQLEAAATAAHRIESAQSCVADVPFAGKRRRRKPYPERRAKKLRRRQSGQCASREEDADDWTGGRDPERDRQRPKHPLAVTRDVTGSDVSPPSQERGQEG